MDFELWYHGHDLWRISYYNYVQMDYHVQRDPRTLTKDKFTTLSESFNETEASLRK